MCTPSVDTSKADAVAAQAQQLTADQWNWVKDQYTAAAPDRAAAAARANEVSDLQIKGMRQQQALGDEAANDYRTIYKPLEQKMANEAANYDTVAHGNELAGKARTDVATQMAGSRGIQDRNMASMGVNVADPAYAAAAGDEGRAEALAQVAAGNKARTDATTYGHALEADAVGIGRGVVGSQATSAGIATSQGNSSVQNANVPNTIANNGIQTVNQGAQVALGGLQTAGNIYGQSSKLNAEAAQSSSAGIGALAGAGMMAFAV